MDENNTNPGSEATTPIHLTRRVTVIPAKARNSMTSENNNGKRKRVAAYARVSTILEAQSSSYDLQVSYFTEYIQKNSDWELVKVYADQGISGTSTKNRTEFNTMIQDCLDGKIDYIITKSISRFARNTMDCLNNIRMLKNLDIGVFFQKENLDTLDSKSELFLTILSSMAQEESRSVSENTKWSIQKSFQQGRIHCPTTYFLGYDTDEDGNIVINEEQAKVVKRIFKEFKEGKGTPSIAKVLMKEGILTARGKPKWTGDGVYKILKQEKYMGHCLAQKSVTLDFLTHKRVRNKDIQPQYYVKDVLPQIISEEEWNDVQQELKRRNKMLHDPDNKYKMAYSSISPFSNKFFCGECGRPVIRRRYTSEKNGEKYHFSAWQCRNSACQDKGARDCTSRYSWEEEIEKAFMKMLLDMKENRDSVISDAEVSVANCALSRMELARLEELERQIKAVSNRISEMATRESSLNDAIYDATIQHLIYEQEILLMELEVLNQNKQESLYLEKQLKVLLEYLDKIEESLKQVIFRNDIFTQVVEKGILYNNQEISFELKCGISRVMQANKKK